MIKNAILCQMKIMVLDKSRPTYHYRFTVTRKKMLLTATLRIVVLEKSKPTYNYRFTFIMIKMLFFARLKLWSLRNLDLLIAIDLHV